MGDITKVLFMGSKALGLKILSVIHSLLPHTLMGVITLDDANDTRTVLNGFKTFCNKNRLPLHIAKNRDHTQDIIGSLKPHLCMVVGWYWLIDEDTLNMVPEGFIGIHNSLLPKYRGGSPLIWQIISDEKTAGFSLFSFSPGMDDGPIWAQGSVPINREDYISDVLAKIEARTIEVVRKVYPKIISGSITPVEQNHTKATYCAQRYPEDGNIDWRKSAYEIYNFIRAQSHPYPGAFTFIDGEILRIWRARPFANIYYGTPGQVAKITDGEVFVICGDNRAVILEEVEIEGKRGKPLDIIKSVRTRFSSSLCSKA